MGYHTPPSDSTTITAHIQGSFEIKINDIQNKNKHLTYLFFSSDFEKSSRRIWNGSKVDMLTAINGLATPGLNRGSHLLWSLARCILVKDLIVISLIYFVEQD